MSDIDKRVVQMDFDNKKFEKNVKQSTESLNTLKSSLNFDGVSNSIDQVTVKISKMEMVVASVISNITNRIVNLGIQLVKSLSIDNISSGWEKFGQKTTSVATLMAQTLKVNGQELTDVTEKLSTVNELMDKLMWFTDETSYSFTDMIDNIGKFTAAGLDLDVSTKAMEGIATWAALSGQNATTASRAMYQLSQAMGKGKIQLIDWKSIQNANMDTAEMRENVLETAVSLGQLTKEGNKYVTKSGKKFTQNQFTEELSEGWFTSEVLTKTLEKYSDATDEIYVIAQKEGLTASEVLEKYGDTLDEFGVKAFKAAQEARTLSDALNSVKDAVASKWMTTSELIFGDKDEAVELWTDLANALYEVFAESGDFRNAILEVWNALGGREDLFKRGGDDQGAFWNIFDAIIAVKDVIKQAWNTIFPLSQMEDESDQAQEIGNTIKQLTSRFKEWTKTIKLSDASALKLQKVLEGVFTVLKGAFALLRAGLMIVSPIIDILKQVASSILEEIVTLIGKLNFSGEGLLSLADRIYEVVGTFFSDVVDIPKIIKTIINVVSTLAKVLGALIKRIYEFVKTSSLIKSVINIFKKLGAMLQKISPVFEKVGGVFTGFVEFVDNSIGALVSSNAISDVDKKVAKPIESALNGLASAINSILNATSLGSVDMSLLSPMAALFTGLYEVFKGAAGIIGILLTTIGRILQLITKGLSALENIALNLETWQIALIAIGAFCAAMMIIIAVIVHNVKMIGYLLSSTIAPWGTFIDSLTGTLDGITRKMTGEMIKAITEALLAFTIAIALLASINPDRLWPAVAAISVLAAVLSGIVVGFILIQNKLNKAKIKKERLLQTFASYMGIASALEVFSSAVLKIAVALYIMGKVDPGRLWSGMGVIGVIAALSIALAAFGKKSKNNLKKALPGIGQMLMIAVLIKSIAKTLDMFKDINNGQRANLLVASAVMSAFMAFCTGFAAVMTFIANRMNFGSASKSISMLFGMVGLILAFGISVKMLASVPWNTTAVVMGVIGGFFVEFAALVTLITLAGKLSKKSKPQAVFREMIGMALLLLAFGATINMLAKIPWSTSAVVLGIVGAFFIEFAGLVALISLSGKLSKKAKPQAVFREMIGMSALLLSFGFSVQILSKIEWATAGVMLGIIGAFFLEFAGLCILITQYGKSASRATFAMLAMSVMMLMFGVMMNLMDSLGIGHMFASVGALAFAFVAMAALFVAISSATKGLGKAVTAVAVITSMTAMLVAYTVMMKLLANVGVGQLFAVVGSLTTLLIAFVGIAALMSKKASILIAALAMSSVLIKFSISLTLMAAALFTLSFAPWSQLLAAAGAIAIVLGSYAGLAITLSKMKGSIKALNGVSIAFLIFSLSLLSVASALTKVAAQPWQNILVAAGAIVAVVSALVGAVALIELLGIGGKDFLKKMVAMSLGLTIFAVAMVGFGHAMKTFQSIDLATIGKSLLAVAGGIVILGVAAALTKSITPAILGLAAAFLMIGMGMILAATAIQMVISTLTTLSTMSEEQLTTVSTAMSAFMSILGNSFGPLLTGLINSISASLPALYELVNNILLGIVNFLEVQLPILSTLVLSFIVGMIERIAELSDRIYNAVSTLITGLLEMLSNNASTWAQSLMEVLINVLKVLCAAQNVDRIVEQTLILVKNFIEALINHADLLSDIWNGLKTLFFMLLKLVASSIVEIAGKIAIVILVLLAAAIRITIASLGALGELLLELMYGILMLTLQVALGVKSIAYEVIKTIFFNLVDTFNTVLQDVGPMLVVSLKTGFKSLLAGIMEALAQLVKDIPLLNLLYNPLHNAAESMKASVSDDMSEYSDILSGANVTKALNKAKNNITNVVKTTTSSVSETLDGAVSNIMSTVNDSLGTLTDVFENNGQYTMEGFANGVNNSLSNVTQSGEVAANEYANSFTGVLGINSPSKVFYEYGEYTNQGFANGIIETKSTVIDSITTMVSEALTAAQNTLDSQNGDDLTIKVGMDISSVEEQTRNISSLMSGINNVNATAYGRNASYNSAAINKGMSAGTVNSTDNSRTVTYNNVFNVSSTDPEQSAEEIDRKLSRQATMAKLAHGGI